MNVRISSHASFWEERFSDRPGLFGQSPNEFVAEHAYMIPLGSRVLELGAGEGRNAIYLADMKGAEVTALDFAPQAVHTATDLANSAGKSIHPKIADLRTLTLEQSVWDAIIMTFVQLLTDERARLFGEIQRSLVPGGVFLGVWFSPKHLSGEYARIGPSKADRLVSTAELKEQFGPNITLCEEVVADLDEGPMLQGKSAITQLIYRKPWDETPSKTPDSHS